MLVSNCENALTVLHEEVPEWRFGLEYLFHEDQFTIEDEAERAEKAGDEINSKAVLSPVGLVSWCCRFRRPKMRPAMVRNVPWNRGTSPFRRRENS